MKLRSVTLAALLACAARPAHAQELDPEPRSLPGWSLERTMREFFGSDAPRGFFPTRGAWTWVLTTHGPGGQDRIGIVRIRADETEAAMAPGGPLCASFNGSVIDPGSILNAGEGRRWKQVGGNRFVPAGRPAGSPVFVEWRREDGRWVVSRFGEEEEYYAPAADARPRIEGVRNGPRGEPLRLPLADSVRVAAGAGWYENREPIVVAGSRLVMYGLPRQLSETDVVRWGTYDGVPIYVEPAMLKSRTPEVVYLPAGRGGSFQPYQNMSENPCAH